MESMQAHFAARTGRLESIDALRGFDMFFIMGGSVLLTAIAAFLPEPFGSGLARHMTHANWIATNFFDYIFSTFLFLAGVSWPFSYAAQVAKGRTAGQIHRKILVRMILLILLGWLHDDILRFDWDHQRLASVIGRIGIAWAVAAFCHMHMGFRRQIVLCIALLIGYWAILYFIPRPGVTVPVGKTAMSEWGLCICGWMDRSFLTVCKPGYDGGLFATIGMPVTALFGTLTGDSLRRTDVGEGKKTLMMLAVAAGLGLVGFLWMPWCPNVKAIWTPTYALVAGSAALMLMAVFHWVIDVKGFRKWAYFGIVIGVNSITIYMLQHFVSFRGLSRAFFGGAAALCSPAVGELVLAAGHVALAWLTLWFFKRKGIFMKV